MTREEEIEKEAKRVSWNGDEYDYFILGAEWADKTMIAKAVEWLKEELIDNRDNFGYAVVSTFDTITLDDFIEDFRKAMEE